MKKLILLLGLAFSFSAGATAKIDILVYYTPEALEQAGSLEKIKEQLQYKVAYTNQAFKNSKIDAEIDVVGILPDPRKEEGDTRDCWYNARRGDINRDIYGADVIATLCRDNGKWLGFADILTSITGNSWDYHMAVRWDSEHDTFAHELGHVLGCAHNIEVPGATDMVMPSARGHMINKYAGDIMSYALIVVAVYSNPDLSTEKGTLGSKDADCAGALRITAPIVSKYRTSNVIFENQLE